MRFNTPYSVNFIIGLLFLLTLASCSEIKSRIGDNKINQGTITYKITYPYLDSNDIGLNLLPDKMTLTFLNNMYKTESVGGMGLFSAGFVSNTDEQTVDHFMKVISSKYVSRFSPKGLKKFYEGFPSYRLEPLDTTKKVAGFNCNATRVVFYNNIISDYIIWHTKEIGIKDFTWCSPFPAIDGVLMEYKVQQEGLVLNLQAEQLIMDSVSTDAFKVPLDYTVVSNETLIRKIEEAFVSFDY